MIELYRRHALDSTQQDFPVPVDWWTFPGGERGVRINEHPNHILVAGQRSMIRCQFQSSDDLLDLLLLHDAVLRRYPGFPIDLVIPYFPYARQDRVMNQGESLSVHVIAKLIRSCGFGTIEVWDPHSDGLAGMFDPGQLIIRSQADLFRYVLRGRFNMSGVALVAPDAGASKKIYKLAAILGTPVIECSKIRDPQTGSVTGVSIPSFSTITTDTLVVVDDICDGGATFIHLGEALRARAKSSTRLVLAVTHGIFSRGRDVLREHYSEIICLNNLERNEA